MDELPKRVLYAFYPERTLTFDQITKRSKVSLPFVRTTINTDFIPNGYVEEVSNGNTKHSYFRLTNLGIVVARQIHSEREWQRARFTELRGSGMTAREAALQLAMESVESDKMTS